MASCAETIPMTAPVCALLQCHQAKAMPSARNASTSAIAAADSCLIQPAIPFQTELAICFPSIVSPICVGNGGQPSAVVHDLPKYAGYRGRFQDLRPLVWPLGGPGYFGWVTADSYAADSYAAAVDLIARSAAAYV